MRPDKSYPGEWEYYESTGALLCHNLRNYPANGRDIDSDTQHCTRMARVINTSYPDTDPMTPAQPREGKSRQINKTRGFQDKYRSFVDARRMASCVKKSLFR